MNNLVITPEVHAFLTAVASELSDLSPDERMEVLDGLEADLAELVAEQGVDALGDPRTYAAELRAAAGVEVGGTTTRFADRVTAALDSCHAFADTLIDALPGNAAEVLQWARPLWWALRAWVAVQLVAFVVGGYTNAELIPGPDPVGLPLLVLAVAASVALGFGKYWPGTTRGPGGRVVLLGLNSLAVALCLPLVLDASSSRYWDGYNQATVDNAAESAGKAGLWTGDRQITNIYPYDAEGRPLTGVQLIDQDGKEINVTGEPHCAEHNGAHDVQADDTPGDLPDCYDAVTGELVAKYLVLYPWSNGAAELFNVFPLPVREQEQPSRSASAFADKSKPTFSEFPKATVPAASLPGVSAGALTSAR